MLRVPGVLCALVLLAPAVVGQEAPLDKREEPTLWNALMFTTPHWDVGLVGLGGVALWATLVAALLTWGLRVRPGDLGVLVAGSGALLLVWSLLPHPGPITQAGFPLLVGAALGWLATRANRPLGQALRLAFVSAVLGGLSGPFFGHALQGLWADGGLVVVGGDRFADAGFTVPLAALSAALLARFVPALVLSLEDEEPQPAAASAAPVVRALSCARCGTPIPLDRAAARHRTATGAFAVACPNCHSWMEAVEPSIRPT